MSKLAIYSLIMLLSVFVSSVSQIGLKIAAKKEYKSVAKEYLNWRVILSYGLFFLSTLLTVFALKVVPISLAPIIESAGYIFVTVMSYLFLKESITKKKILGMVLILIGIFVYAIF